MARCEQDRFRWIRLQCLAPDVVGVTRPQRQEQRRCADRRPHRLPHRNLHVCCRETSRNGSDEFVPERIPAVWHPGVLSKLADEGSRLVEIPRPKLVHGRVGGAASALIGPGETIA